MQTDGGSISTCARTGHHAPLARQETLMKTLAVLVTGATGKQGGAVARQLVKKGHRVRAFTRNVASRAARTIATTGVELVAGNLDDRVAVDRAVAGMDAVFCLCTPFGS